MKRTNLLLPLTAFIVLINLWACHEKSPNKAAKVYIDQRDGRYAIIRNGKPFAMKGAGGYSHFRELREAGGNTLRTWDTSHLAQVLDSARRYDIAVIVGLPIPNSGDLSLYQDPDATQKRLQAFRALIRRYKGHPSILMWCLGNELDFPYKLRYLDFYKAFNGLTDMIHAEDPDHPITTTILNFNPKYIYNIRLLCDIDLLSFNIFSTLPKLRKDLKNIGWFWKGPYMLLEWGINGPWQGTEQTAWGAYIEDTSKKKADVYKARYYKDMPLEDPRFLGGCVFFWGSKQETTHTWFSIFDETGRSSEALSSMHEIWNGKPSGKVYPDIKFMLLNGQGARGNVILTPREKATAEVLLFKGNNRIRMIHWQVFQEDWYRHNHLNSTKKLRPILTVDNPGDNLHLTFASPPEEGPYRIFATIYDDEGNFASCNTPFYVVNQP